MQQTAAGYDADFALWAESQATALREGRFRDLDVSHLIEEIDDLSNRKRDGIRSRLTKLAVHLLKLQFQPERESGSWRGSIIEHARRIRQILEASPSLRRELVDYEPRAYADARPQAAAETRLPLAAFPAAPTPEFARALRDALAGEDFAF